MSRSNEMAEMLLHWLRQLELCYVNYPIYLSEALVAVEGLEPMEAIQRICENNPTALQVLTDDPNHLVVEPSFGGHWCISEMVWQPEDHTRGIGEHYIRQHTKDFTNAVEAVVNLKQRFEFNRAREVA